jgi:hypothetical protein
MVQALTRILLESVLSSYEDNLRDVGGGGGPWMCSVQIIAVMIKRVRISETSVCLNETTRRYIPEGCILSRRRENLKSRGKYDDYSYKRCLCT